MNEIDKPNNRLEEFRSVSDMHQPDRRQTALTTMAANEEWHGKTIEDHHAKVAQYPLNDAVPEPILIQWETARNIWLYAWHVWRFHAIAETHAYVTLEYALRIRLGGERTKRPPGLKELMDQAISQKLLADAPIEHYQRRRRIQVEQIQEENEFRTDIGLTPLEPIPVADPQAYCQLLAQSFPMLRNHYAHGSRSVHPGIGVTFSLCRDLINQLFE